VSSPPWGYHTGLICKFGFSPFPLIYFTAGVSLAVFTFKKNMTAQPEKAQGSYSYRFLMKTGFGNRLVIGRLHTIAKHMSQ
jgi:hypothetical protein